MATGSRAPSKGLSRQSQRAGAPPVGIRVASPAGAKRTYALPGERPLSGSTAGSRPASHTGASRCPNCSGALLLPLRRCPRCQGVPGPGSRNGRTRGSHVGSLAEHSAPLTDEEEELLTHLREGGEVDLELVGELLQASNGAAANVREASFGWAPIMFAAHRGETELLTLLLKARANLQASCKQGNTALHLAARNGKEAAVALLLNRNAELEKPNALGWTPLAWASLAGRREVASLLVEARAQLEHGDSAGRMPTMWAARHGHILVLKDLLAAGFDPNLHDEEGLTVEDHARQYEEMQAWLPDSPAKRLSVNHLAAAGIYEPANADGSVDLVHLLRQHGAKAIEATEAVRGADEDSEDEDEAEPVFTSPVEVVADCKSKSEALLAAAEAADWEAVEAGLRKGACGWIQSLEHLRSPLMWAAIHNAPASIMALAAAKASLETRDAFGWTALRYAAHSGSSEAVSVLHYLGADFSTKCDAGDTILHLAAKADREGTLQLLCSAIGDVNGACDSGETPLQAAASSGCPSSLKVLLSLRADARIVDERQRSVLAMAVVNGHEEILRALVEPLQPLTPPFEESAAAEILSDLPWVAEEPSSIDGTHGVSIGVAQVAPKKRGRRQSLGVIKEEDERESRCGSPASSAGSGSPDLQRPTSRESQRSSVSRASASTAASNRSRASVKSKGSVASRRSSRSAASTSKRGKRRSSAVGKDPKEEEIPKSPVQLLIRTARRKPCQDVIVPSSDLLASVDVEGRAPLALAVLSHRYDLVPVLIELRAHVDVCSKAGETALMLAAAATAREVVTQLIEARANADIADAKGRRAIDYATRRDIRDALKEHSARSAAERKLGKSFSLPSLVPPTPKSDQDQQFSRSRLRLDGLPKRHAADHLEELIFALVKSKNLAPPSNVQVEVDPISLRPRGHAFVDFGSTKRADMAERTLRAETNVSVSREAVPLCAIAS
eukprot:TRINITY_DN14868_c0_g1_i2.p1 TRINITY_DN14868_c0_g1~~TRINITY_DN14868_c0_g1_i2.p1  ORF type:complete len:958 (-),score=142.19 TRINITY_DN14868_c0_g1_i2:87-2960(-)